MEEAQLLAEQQAAEPTVGNPEEIGQGLTSALETLPSIFVRNSNPTTPGADTEDAKSLSQLESALRVARTSKTHIHELLPTSDISKEMSVASFTG